MRNLTNTGFLLILCLLFLRASTYDYASIAYVGGEGGRVYAGQEGILQASGVTVTRVDTDSLGEMNQDTLSMDLDSFSMQSFSIQTVAPSTSLSATTSNAAFVVPSWMDNYRLVEVGFRLSTHTSGNVVVRVTRVTTGGSSSTVGSTTISGTSLYNKTTGLTTDVEDGDLLRIEITSAGTAEGLWGTLTFKRRH